MGRCATYPMTTPTAPADHWSDRPGDQSGGPVTSGAGRAITPGLVDGQTRENANPNEQGVQHERVPTYHLPYMTGSNETRVNWTECGPIRSSLWMRNTTIRRQSGSDATRFFDPHPITGFGTQDQGHGMHTNPPQPKAGVNKNFRARQQQTGARVNRLSPAAYTGQSYSQTTQIQGGR